MYTNSTKARGSDADSFGLDRPPPVTGGWGGGCVGSAIAVGSGVAVAVGSLVGVGSAVGSVGWRNPIRHWPDGIFVPHRLAEHDRQDVTRPPSVVLRPCEQLLGAGGAAG